MGFNLGKVVGDVVSFGTGGISDMLGLTHGLDGTKQQKDANKMAMRAWNLANDYNHPINQMERLKMAGLNPLLVYGSGSVTGNTTGQPALVGGGISTGAESAFKGLGNVMSLLQGKANLDLSHAQTNASNAAAGASGAQAANLQAQATAQEKRNEFLEKTLIADLDYKKAQTRLANNEANKAAAEADIAAGEASIYGNVGGVKGATAIGRFGANATKMLGSLFRH